MSRGSARVCIIVIAIGEVCAVVQQQAEAALAELVAIPFQVVPAKLVNGYDDNQLGARVISRSERSGKQADSNQADDQHPPGESHRDVVYSVRSATPMVPLIRDAILSRRRRILRALE